MEFSVLLAVILHISYIESLNGPLSLIWAGLALISRIANGFSISPLPDGPVQPIHNRPYPLGVCTYTSEGLPVYPEGWWSDDDTDGSGSDEDHFEDELMSFMTSLVETSIVRSLRSPSPL